MNIRSQKWVLSRRHCLKSLGVSIALPMLECMQPIQAQSSINKGPIARSVFIYLPNGVNTLDWQILQTGKNYQLTEPLQPLSHHKENITPISGLHHPHALGFHHGCQAIWLSGAKRGPGARNSISIDQKMAELTAPQTRFSSLALSNTGRTLSHNSDGIPIPAETKPNQIFKRLFHAPAGGIKAERRLLSRRASILDAVLAEAKQLQHQMGKQDLNRLDQYLTSVREIEVRTERADAWLDIPRPKISKEDQRKVDKNVVQQKTGEYFRAMYDLIVLAFQTDMTRVATFSSGDEGKGLPVSEININQTRHSLSHHNGDPEQLRRLTECDRFNIQQLAYFLDRLKETTAQDSNLLDHTMVLFGSGMAYGHSHGNANIPTVLAGGSQLGIKHGQHVDYNIGHFDGYNVKDAKYHYGICSRPKNKDAHFSNLLLTMGQKMGLNIDQFSDSNGVLKEIIS